MFVESNLGYEKNLLLISPPNKDPQAAEYALSNGPATCDLSSLSSDQQNQVAVVQALMDLNASPHISYHSADTLSQQALTIEVPQKFERKSCNCTKSHCLKLYCECFARGQSCDGCNCSNCMNNYNFEDDRRRAIKSTLERNPLAFYPKIGSSMKKHSKGCNCKRSNCLKNYCECYEAKISCSDLCKCRGCRNFVKPPPRDAVPNVESTNFSQPCDRFFSACITREVIEVACSCMLSQLYLANHHDMSETEQEHVVLVEFAKCLDHILDSVDKLRTAEYSGEKYGKPVSPLISSDVFRSADRGVACACPSCSSSEIPRPNPSDLAMPLPYALENLDDAYYSNTFQSIVSDDPSCVEYSNFFVSSDISEVPPTHYDPTHSSFQTVMSAGMGETSNLVEISDLSETIKGTTTEPTILIPYNLFSPNSSEVHNHLIPASSSPSPPLPPQTQLTYQLDQQSFLMSSSGGNVSGEETFCYPLTHSTEADLAAAAISAEVDPILVVSNPDDCDFDEDVDEGGDCGGVDCVGVGDDAFHPHGFDTAYYNLSNPFDLIPSEF